jgi:hypothetical protein
VIVFWSADIVAKAATPVECDLEVHADALTNMFSVFMFEASTRKTQIMIIE